MISTSRKELIIELLKLQSTVSVSELVSYLKASSATIRRDLTDLETEGIVMRTHGGARLIQTNESIDAVSELPIKRKIDIRIHEKIRIAKYAANLVNDGEYIFLDSGTTPAYIYDFVKNKKVTIVTNNLMLVDKVKPNENAHIIFGAGEYNPALKLVSGYLYLDIISRFNFSHAFIGATGFDLQLEQCTCTTAETASFKKCAMGNSRNSYLVADSSKKDKKGVLSFASFNDFTSIITTDFNEACKAENVIKC